MTKEQKEKIVTAAKDQADQLVQNPSLVVGWLASVQSVYQQGASKVDVNSDHRQFCDGAQSAAVYAASLVKLDKDQFADLANEYSLALAWVGKDYLVRMLEISSRAKSVKAKLDGNSPITSLSLGEITLVVMDLDEALRKAMHATLKTLKT